MKKIGLFLTAIILGGTMSHAQDVTHEVTSLVYGSTPFSSVVNDFLGEAISLTGGDKTQNAKSFGSFSIEYFYNTSSLVGVGAILSYSHTSKDVVRDKNPIGTYTWNNVSIMPAIKLNWIQKEHFGFYSKVAAGISIAAQDIDALGYEGVGSKASAFFNFQVSPVGIEAGSMKLRGFAELGLGEQGIALVGLRCRF